jgi:RHS repeat-associated protein
MTGDTLQRNGNINQMMWRTRGRERQAYNFSYDYLDRLRSAVYADVNDAGTVTQSKNFNESLTYADARGNIGTLRRQGPLAAGGCTYGQIDNLSYTYYTGMNRLKTITDGSTPMGFKPLAGATDYLYDANGNMYSDPHKGLTITYNHLNLPKTFNFGGGKVIDILYDAAGNKLRKTIIGSASNYTQEYIGGIEYRGSVREAIYTAEGRYNSGTSRYEYTIKDHLGNARISFTDVNANGTVDFSTDVLQENHYYPFGLGFDGNWKNDAALDNKYQYNGKEINDDFGLNWYNYGKRWYDAAIGRFPTVDPIASDFAFVTPYNYAENEPVANIDLWGLQKASFKENVAAFLIGAADAYVSNAIPGRERMSTDAIGGGTEGAFADGHRAGDMASIFIGGYESLFGIQTAATGAVLVPETGGLSGGAVVVGGAFALHGAYTSANGLYNLFFSDDDGSPQKGNRAKETDDANKQVDGLQKAQDKAKDERPSNKTGDWEGSKRPHQEKIQGGKKSESRADHQNKRTSTKSYDDDCD